nr:ATP synthase F0 subunit 8 [Stigmatomma silvestrii]
MPQMMPMLWLVTYYYILLIMMLLIIFFFFLYQNKNPLKLDNMIKKIYWSWKW